MLIIGHRGAKGLAPENTLESIEAAIRHGVDAVEFDVRTTKDNVPVLIHDSAVSVSGRDLAVHRTLFKDLKTANRQLATLDEALRAIKNRVPVVIEIKEGTQIAPVADCVRARIKNEWKSDNISVSSFSFRILRVIKQELPEITLIVNEPWSGVRASHRARKLGTKFITMNQKWLWSGFIRSISRRFKLSAYTINEPTKAQKWAKHGLYAAITDYPDRFKS